MKRLFTVLVFLTALLVVSNLSAQTVYWTEGFEDGTTFPSSASATLTDVTLSTSGTWTIYYISRGTNTSYVATGTADLRMVKPSTVVSGGGTGFCYVITPKLANGVGKITLSEGRGSQPVTIDKSTDDGTTWTTVGTITSSPAKTPTSLDVNDSKANRLRISNQNTSKDIDVDDVAVTSYVSGTSAVEDYTTMPVQFSLDQNYPNPFNPSTKISFSIEKAGFTTLNIYNVLGQKVAGLVSRELAAGQHELSFDASKLNSGIYFYKLESGSFSATKKMMLVK
jgi:hypothetical protein